MATTHAPGTGIATVARRHGRRTAVIAGVVLVGAAIVVPFGVRGLDRDGPPAAGATGTVPPPAPSPATAVQRTHQDGDLAALGPKGDLPPLLAGDGDGVRAGLEDGARVRVGDITEGTVRRSRPDGWQVMVRWDGRLQPLPTRGPVTLRDGVAWVSSSGLLYTRLPTSTPGRFRVYAWEPHGGSAYTPPELVAEHLGRVCFNSSFTSFGTCHAAG
jgi:hypothetical protein